MKKRTNWWGLSFLTTESLEDAECVIADYPWLLEMYQEIAVYRENPEEVPTMFRDALAVLDTNTMQYMIDEQKQEIEEQKQALEEKDKEIARLQALLAQNK